MSKMQTTWHMHTESVPEGRHLSSHSGNTILACLSSKQHRGFGAQTFSSSMTSIDRSMDRGNSSREELEPVQAAAGNRIHTTDPSFIPGKIFHLVKIPSLRS